MQAYIHKYILMSYILMPYSICLSLFMITAHFALLQLYFFFQFAIYSFVSSLQLICTIVFFLLILSFCCSIVIQIDNQLFGSSSPVLLFPTPLASKAETTKETPALELSICAEDSSFANVDIYRVRAVLFSCLYSFLLRTDIWETIGISHNIHL